jgi:hypothetical protein
MYRPRALKDRLTTEMERWRLCHEEHRSLGGCNTKWVPAWSAAPPPRAKPGSLVRCQGRSIHALFSGAGIKASS